MSHTPGPWFVREPDPDERQADIAEGLAPEDMELTEVYAEDGGEQVCYVMNDTPAEASNARLIAAAPELLAACRQLLEWAREEYQSEVNEDALGPIWRAASGAIAKAEGRTR